MNQLLDYDEQARREKALAAHDIELGIAGSNRPTHLNIPIQEWDITVKLYNLLKDLTIATLADLRLYEREEIASPRGFGKQTMNQLDGIVETYGGYFYEERHNRELVKQRLEAGYHWIKKTPHLRKSYGLKELPAGLRADPVHARIQQWCEGKEDLLLSSVDKLDAPMAEKLHQAGLHILGAVVIEENPQTLSSKGFDEGEQAALADALHHMDKTLVLFMRQKAELEFPPAADPQEENKIETEKQRARISHYFK